MSKTSNFAVVSQTWLDENLPRKIIKFQTKGCMIIETTQTLDYIKVDESTVRYMVDGKPTNVYLTVK